MLVFDSATEAQLRPHPQQNPLRVTVCVQSYPW